jgi:hypothetical protein
MKQPKLLDGFNFKSKGDNNERKMNCNTLPGWQHFGVKGMLRFQDGTKTSNMWVNYSHEYAQTKQQVG